MITRFYADNFRCLINFELKLDEANVFLGPNGSGKTSVLNVLSGIQKLLVRGAKIDEAFSARDLSLAQARNEQRFELDVELDGHVYRYVLGIEHDRERRRMRIGEEVLEQDGKPLFAFRNGTAQLYHDDFNSGPSYPFDWSQSGVGVLNERHDNRKLTRFKKEIASFVIASPCPPLFEPETRAEDEFFEPLMQNFVGWYRHAAQENMGSIAKLFTVLGEALPGFDSLNLTESGENSRALKVVFSESAENRPPIRYGFDQLSDGQRSLVALYCLLFLSTSRRTSLFLDEPDNYLALREVQPWLAEVVDRCGDTLEQAVLVSHHPVTIDYMAGAKGRWFYRDKDGPARVSSQPERTADGLSLSETVARGWEAVSGVSIVLLCEDSQTDSFVRRFLKRHRDIRNFRYRVPANGSRELSRRSIRHRAPVCRDWMQTRSGDCAQQCGFDERYGRTSTGVAGNPRQTGRLFRMCHEEQSLDEPAPPSLIEACEEYRRLTL